MDENLYFSELPYAAAVSEECFGVKKVCWCCFLEKEKLNFCSICKTAVYCSKECQKKDWKPQHKHECSVFEKSTPTEMKEIAESVPIRLLARILFRKSVDKGIQCPEGECMYTLHSRAESAGSFLFRFGRISLL